ncbi:unnamed protein product [Arctia plantaginis]|uniref:Uncharacterized protein n=1 Tax=Arctia plantaginis TaxID=874455 RepID=A0A8S0Z405_ARCPL|nr:unnamed protein product [Arctia plantaginis]
MITRARASRARLTPPDSSLRSAVQSPEVTTQVPVITEASSSTSSDEFFSPPTSPTPVRRQGRGRPPVCLGSRGPSASNRAPAIGGNVRRMKWTSSMNENVMRAYFVATEGETNLTAYRNRLLTLFQELEPTVNVTVQRLSDQVRAIKRCNLLNSSVLERLRSDLQISLTTFPSSQAVTHQDLEIPQASPAEGEEIDASSVSTQYNDIIRNTLEGAILEYGSMNFVNRPRLPRLPMHKRNKALVCALDSILPPYFEKCENLSDTHSILYCAAVTACRVAGVKFSRVDMAPRPKSLMPSWQCRIERRIAEARVLIGKLIRFRSGNTRPRVMRFVNQTFSGTGIRSCDYMARVTERIDFLKQKVYAWANRIRRYKKRVDRYTQNRTSKGTRGGFIDGGRSLI